MNDKINWRGIEDALMQFASTASAILDSYNEKNDANTNLLAYEPPGLSSVDPLSMLPYRIRESITTEFYEPGMTSPFEQYIENDLIKQDITIEGLINGIYKFAVKKSSHILAWNTIVVLSELSYDILGDWADMLAITATRSQYLDVVEMGIRCFENWECIDACEFLQGCHFEEKWLQEYVDQVCEYVMKEGWSKDVLSTKDYSWEMAERIRIGTKDIIERYPSRYSSS